MPDLKVRLMNQFSAKELAELTALIREQHRTGAGRSSEGVKGTINQFAQRRD